MGNTSRSRSRIQSWILAGSVAFLLASCGTLPKTTITMRGDSSYAATLAPITHELFTSALQTVITDEGAIDMTALKSNEDLTEYLHQLAQARIDVFPSRLAQLAFWINAHNAYVLDILRNNKLGRSINDIDRMFTGKVAVIGGVRYSLSEIRDNVLLRKLTFREPRMFFALSNGARSGPRFWKEAYIEQKVSEQLDRAVRAYFADSTKTILDRANNTLKVSEFVQDHRSHLEQPAGTLVTFIRAFAPPSLGEYIDQHPAMKISYLRYDHSPYLARK